jgi:streptogramin lyase
MALDEWFVHNNIPEALKKALHEEGFDTEETLAELTEDFLQSLCTKTSVHLTQGLKIKFRKLSERVAMTARRLSAMQSATREINELREMHSQRCITDKELEANRRLILTKHGLTAERDGDGIGTAASEGPNASVPASTPDGITLKELEPRNLPNLRLTDPLDNRLQVIEHTDGSFVRSVGWGKGRGPTQFACPRGVATLSSGHVVVCESQNHRLQVVNPIDGSFVRFIGNGYGSKPNQFDRPYGVATLPNGHVVVSDCGNHRLQVVNPIDGSFARSIGKGKGSGPDQFRYPHGVTILPNGHVVVCDQNNHRLQVVDPMNGSFVRSIGNGQGSGPNQFDAPYGVATLPNGQVVVSDSGNHRLQVVDPIDGSFVRSLCDGRGSGPNSVCDQFELPCGVATLPNGQVVVVDTFSHCLQVVDPIDGSFLRSIGNGPGSGPDQFRNPYGVATLPNGQVVVSDTLNDRLQVVNLSDESLNSRREKYRSLMFCGSETLEVLGHGHAIHVVRKSPLGSLHEMRRRSLEEPDGPTYTCIATLEDHADKVYSVAFSAAETQAASASRDKTVKVWDVATWTCIATLEGHVDKVYSVAYSPAGTYVVSCSGDKTV